jgi:small-conductance mechanosensitive channel
LWLLGRSAGSVAPEPSAPVPPPIAAGDVAAHLQQTISWYRHISAVEQPASASSGVMLRDTLHPLAVKALQLAFDFARAANALQNAANAGESGANLDTGGRMQQALARAADRVARIQKAIDDLDSAAGRRGHARASISAERKQLLAQLDFAKQMQKTVQSLSTFAVDIESEKDSLGGLGAQINQLARSVPEAEPGRQNQPSPPARAAPAAGQAQSTSRPEPGGIFGLASELFAVTRSRAQLKQLIDETDGLLKSMDQLRTPLSNELRSSVSRGDTLAKGSGSADPEELANRQRELETLTARFKELSTVMIPLREQMMMVETVRENLVEWRDATTRRYGTVGGSLLLRVAGLGLAVCLVLALSGFWRRMTFRYVRDPRRRRQFLLVRRIAVAAAIAMIVLLSFITEIGSLATYAGFLTAGLAVALQNVILSVVAYFFLIGRHGLRVGDRVTVGGVTGDVLDVGLVRLYLMELAGTGADHHVTGRIVVFSNSVLFQPSALFKQLPGTEYLWRTATLILTRDSDYQLAESTLMAAVDSVYQEYGASIERQHEAFERSVDLKVSSPHPEGRLRFTDAGLEFTVRYPAEMRSAATIDDRVIKALYEAIAKEPRLTLAPSGEPKLVES